jgi:hypothetical protein
VWEARYRRRYGSGLAGVFTTRSQAEAFASEEIRKHGGVGRIELVSVDSRVVYYDVYPEDEG